MLALTVKLMKHFHVIQGTVSIGIADPVQAGRPYPLLPDHDVQPSVDPGQPVCPSDGQCQLLDDRFACRAGGRRRCDAKDRTVLIGRIQIPPTIRTQRNP